MTALFWVGLLAVCAVSGYAVLRAVPPLLHTPLMSGMNALSGIAMIGAMAALSDADSVGVEIAAGIALALATANAVGGFAITDRMLRMFARRSERKPS
jgi:NAD(P) transhydrogenase subunit alpha